MNTITLSNIHLDGLHLIYLQCIADKPEEIVRYVLTMTSKSFARRLAEMLYRSGASWLGKIRYSIAIPYLIRMNVRVGNSCIVMKLYEHAWVYPSRDQDTQEIVPGYFKPNAVSPSFALYLAGIAPAIQQHACESEYFDFRLAEILSTYLPSKTLGD